MIDPDTSNAPEHHDLPATFDTDRHALPEGLVPVESGYKWVLRAHYSLFWLPLLFGALVLDNFVFADFAWRGMPSLVIGAIMLAVTLFVPHRVWRRLGYRLADRHLRIVRGWLFHTDTIVPFVRTQHLDVARGPLDKIFGTASLIIHTAGTHNSVVKLPGLAPERAIELRDTIRAEIKTDWQ